MCLGIPARVVAIVDAEAGIARAEVGGVRRDVSTLMLDEGGVAVGDWVLVHVGFALAKIDEAEAEATLRLLHELGTAGREELAAWRSEPDPPRRDEDPCAS
jgi:hydrogenase expression/formation protein HypC